MVQITRLKLKNFKSFKKAEIPFSPGFTAIAGSNASGKSNILDSLLFGFGITSLKMLRASKLVELINHDATENYAKVEIELQAGDNTYVISRIIDKQGKSLLRLNGKRKTLNEVSALLEELNIDPKGHNIVCQGDITKIIEMNAKQRREIIDNVAGLSEFEDKKNEALSKLEKVEQKVKEVNIVLKERESKLEELTKEREAALRHKALTEEFKKTKATILHTEINRIKTELAGSKRKLEAMQQDIERRVKEKEESKNELKELESKLEETNKKMIQSSEQTYMTIGRQVEEKKAELRIIEERLQEKNNRINKLETQLKEFEEGSLERVESQKAKSARIDELTKELDALDEKKVKMDSVLNNQTEKRSKLNNQIKELELELQSIFVRIDSIKEELYPIKAQQQAIESNKDTIEKLLQKENLIKEKLEKRDDLQEQIKDIGELTVLQTELKNKEEKYEIILTDLSSFKTTQNNIKEELDSLNNADSVCPVCDQDLNDSQKDKIRVKKEEKISNIITELERLQNEQTTLLKEKKDLLEKIRQVTDLNNQIMRLGDVDSDLDELEKTIQTAKAKTSLNIDELKEQEKKLEIELAQHEAEKNNLDKKLEDLKNSPEKAELDEIVTDYKKISEEKNEKEKELTKLIAEIESIKTIELNTNKDLQKINSEIEELKKDKVETDKQVEEVKKDYENKKVELEKATHAQKVLEEEKNRISNKIQEYSKKIDELENKIQEIEKERNEFNIETSKNEVRIVDLEEEYHEFKTIELLKEFDLAQLKERLPEIEKEIEKIGPVNMKALENFDGYFKEVQEIREKADKLDQELKAVLEMINKIELKKLNVFMECYNVINSKFQDLYKNFFESEGLLRLTNEENPLEGGLSIEAMYKEDKLKSIDAMSGGEKSLTALSFLFAILSYQPSPFYIFDEVDAALDIENSVKIGRMINKFSRHSQFISISHNSGVIKQADQIIGVALNKQKSSVVGLRLAGKIKDTVN